MQTVVETQQFVMGPAAGQLELEIARLARAQHGIACASGTDALLLPLKALQLRPGEEVITTPFTFFATAGTIHNAGGTRSEEHTSELQSQSNIVFRLLLSQNTIFDQFS